MNRYHNPLDRFITGADKALRVLAGVHSASRPNPAVHAADADMTEQEHRHSAGLMRVNHVGEVMAQALYNSQARFAKSDEARAAFDKASREEEDHLLGTAAALAGDKQSLGFVVETERQVEAHLASHLDKLPPQDAKSRAIVEQMRVDEIAHGKAAEEMGAEKTPLPIQLAMKAMSKVMTSTTYYV
ncbi:MAG: 2-octaprenyl-3-methyl-6-methoxy,4-benzoquinol hydroxylase [Pseudoduganella sp.]|nr:2-octaprenyl-3-methyl-6-methoxy,4-benzoquinol hydroxylase [Pseudoduganella sp.]